MADSLQLASASDASGDSFGGGNGDSGTIVMSPDGRFVLFASTANNLLLTTNSQPMPTSFPWSFNVFLRDRTNATTTLISANLSGVRGGDGDSIPADLSTNGQTILFESSATDLVENDTNNFTDIFVRKLTTNSTTLVSVSTNGGNANGDSRSAVITPNGRYVAFVSAASNLVAGDTNEIPDIFVHDLQSGTTALASPGARAFNSLSSSEAPEISADGRYVAFYSTATNLVSGAVASSEIYVRDLFLNTTIRVSAVARTILFSVTGSNNAVSWNHAISSDGKLIAYAASNPNQSIGLILRYNIDSGTTDIVHTNAIMPTGTREDFRTLDMTPNGRFVAFLANTGTVAGAVSSVVAWDANTGTTTVASLNRNGVAAVNPFGSAASFESPAIDSTGRYVSFVTTATNLTTNVFDFGFHAYVRDLQLNKTTLVDADTKGIPSDLLPFVIPRLSANGRFVAFASFESGLAEQNSRRNYHVFMRDMMTNTVELISARNPDLASVTPDGASLFSTWSISGNGRYVAFASLGSNLATNDTNFNRDIFVRDLLEQTTTLVSGSTNGFSAAGMSFEPSISSDGRYVAFTSSATNLVAGDTNRANDVFVCNLETRAIVRANGTTVGNGSSFSPTLSADGRYIFFISKASNIAPGSFASGSENLFWREINSNVAGTFALTTTGLANVAVTPDGRYAAYRSTGSSVLYIWDSLAAKRIYTNTFFNGLVAAISPDGTRLAYTQSGQLHILNRIGNTSWSVGALPGVARAGIKFSADGNLLTFASSHNQGFTDTNGTLDVYLYEIQSKTKILVSRADGLMNAANGASDAPDISHDGRFVAYRSAASNIVPNDSNGWPDVFVYDRFTGENMLRSRNRVGDSGGNNRSMAPAFSGDGKTLMFPSWASDLAANDFNQSSDLFAFAFLYTTITRNAGEPPVISWPATPGQTYQAQYKNDLNDPNWLPVNGTVVITDNQASIQDLSPNSEHRIYQVVGF